jgi:Asp-tRNA(Asn)/Glu-tRNA(Gln) amidotransferase A subunit family amidase
MAELAHLSVAELSRRIEQREISCREAVEGYLARIAAYDGAEGLNAFITVAADEARAEADRLDQLLADGTHLGPLHGIPLAIKDNLDTAGIKTTGGTKALANHTPSSDAHVVAKLKEAGAIVLGKTNMHEFAFGITSNNPHFGPVRNPHDPTRIAGGSSGGSAAAVAAGLCPAAIGTDTGGSIRIPAAVCGTVGLKPTLGRVGRGGLMYLATTFDCIGPITHTATDAALILQAIAGSDPRDAAASTETPPAFLPKGGSWRGVRLGVPRDFFYEDNDPAVTQAMEEALQKMEGAGAELVEVRLEGAEGIVPAGFAIVLPESVHLINGYLRQLDSPLNLADILDQLGPEVGGILGSQVGAEGAAPIPGYVYLDAVRGFRTMFQANMAATLAGVDALVTPTTPLPASPIGEDAETMLNERMVETFGAFIRYTFLVNMAGNPALSVPVGKTETGLPLGLQFIGAHWAEAKLLQLGQTWLAS